MMKTMQMLMFFAVTFFVMAVDAQPTYQAADVLEPLPAGAVSIQGYVGNKIDLAIKNRVMAQDVEKVVQPFRDKNEMDFGGFRTEYWGKWITAAELACRYQPSQNHNAIVGKAVRELLATQTPDGYIGTYTKENQLKGWDMWGRKYVLLGLINYYDLTKDKKVLDAAKAALDYTINQFGSGKANIAENGLDALRGLPSSSILEPVTLLYQRTQDKRYLNFANYIVKQWGIPNQLSPNGLNLIQHAALPPIQVAPKGYEMISCFEGLCELYRATGDKKLLDAAVSFGNSFIKNEKMITGSGSNQELWCNGAFLQTNTLEQPMETCVTATWMKYCYQLLRLTGDAKWADELELSLYNALLGAMMPQGNWWTYFSPLNGERVPSQMQHPDVGLSCCVASGPRGLMITPEWAVMQHKKGIIVNLYAPGTASFFMANGTAVVLTQTTDYPVEGRVKLTVQPATPVTFDLKLRIPAWSKTTTVTVNGQTHAARPGAYLTITRKWSNGDEVLINLDMRGRILPAPGGAAEFAVMRGPVVLALDSRFLQPQDTAVWLLPTPYSYKKTNVFPDAKGYVLPQLFTTQNKSAYITLMPLANKPAEVWMAFEVPFLVRPMHFFYHSEKKLVMCDYASAGNRFSSDNTLRVWLSQPLFLNNVFAKDTWKIMYPENKDRPEVPQQYKR